MEDANLRVIDVSCTGSQIGQPSIDFDKAKENGDTFIHGLMVLFLLVLVYAAGKFLGLVDYERK